MTAHGSTGCCSGLTQGLLIDTRGFLGLCRASDMASGMHAQVKAQNWQNPACLEPCGFKPYAPRRVRVSK